MRLQCRERGEAVGQLSPTYTAEHDKGAAPVGQELRRLPNRRPGNHERVVRAIEAS